MEWSVVFDDDSRRAVATAYPDVAGVYKMVIEYHGVAIKNGHGTLIILTGTAVLTQVTAAAHRYCRSNIGRYLSYTMQYLTRRYLFAVSAAQFAYVEKCSSKKHSDTYFEALLLADDKNKKVYCYISSKVCRLNTRLLVYQVSAVAIIIYCMCSCYVPTVSKLSPYEPGPPVCL